MPTCAVQGCKNNTASKERYKKNLSFHSFPKNILLCDKWEAAIRSGRDNPVWQSNSHSVVCSDHFDEADLYTTKTGVRRVTRYGYPKKYLIVEPFRRHSAVYHHTSTIVLDQPVQPNKARDCNCGTLPPTEVLDIPGPRIKIEPICRPSPSTSSVRDLDKPGTRIKIEPICLPSPSTSSVRDVDEPVQPNKAIDSNCVIFPTTSSTEVLDIPGTTIKIEPTCIPSPSTSSDEPIQPNEAIDGNCVLFPTTSSTEVLDIQGPVVKIEPTCPPSPSTSSVRVLDEPVQSSKATECYYITPPTDSPKEVLNIQGPMVKAKSTCFPKPKTSSVTIINYINKRPIPACNPVLDSLRIKKLREKIMKQDIRLREKTKKIKTLQQQARRLKRKNLSLKKIINKLKSPNFNDIDLDSS
ncbi:uncharacterized protein [Epargyreus clarus]|uniref:uncharacterized protein isoform X3 n=1 Tax=Epargyreus clarus TaxID=520877 RepID=UPI003C2F9E35